MRFDHEGYRVIVDLEGGVWKAWVRKGGPSRLAVSGYATESETLDAVKRWIDEIRRGKIADVRREVH